MRYITALLGLVGVTAGSSLHRDSSVKTLKRMMEDIRAHVVLEGENVDIFNGSVDNLGKAEREAERQTRGINARRRLMAKRNKSSIGLGGPKYPIVPQEMRETIKQDLLKVSKSGQRRPGIGGLEEIEWKANIMEAIREQHRQRQMRAEMRAERQLRAETRAGELEAANPQSAFDRSQEALKRVYRRRHPVLVAMERRVNTAEALKELAEFIHTHMHMSPENAVLVYKTLTKLNKAEEAAQKAHHEYLMDKAGAGPAFNGDFVSGTVPDAIRTEIKAALLKIYNESTFRPVGAPTITADDLEATRAELSIDQVYENEAVEQTHRDEQISRDRAIARIQAHLAEFTRRF